jgi:hypothetical protein
MRRRQLGGRGEAMSASGKSTSERRLDGLIDFVLDGSCTDDERQEFAQLIEEHPELIKGITEEVFVHSLLQWQSESISRDLAVYGLSELSESQGCDLSSTVETSPTEASQSLTRRFTIWALAATLLFVSTLVFWQFSKQRRWSDLAVAEIIDLENVSWDEGTTGFKAGNLIVPGRLRTQSGEFTMRFRSGPVVRVVGAVSMMVESDMLVHLDRCQATTRVPNSMKGFTIKTPVIDVIDQGTEFGVATREDGHTDVVVFDGKVDLADRIGNQHGPTRLIQGQAARVNRQGVIQRIMQIGRNQRGSWWTADYPGSGIIVIQGVRDTIPPSDGSDYFCYHLS